MSPSGLVRLALLGEGFLVVVALVWQGLREIPMTMGDRLTGILIGLVVAGIMAGVNAWVLCSAPDLSMVRSIRRLYLTTLKPMFGQVRGTEIVVVSLAAGWGEELLFRGVLLPEVGLVGSSLIFGLLHTGGRGTLAFGAWAAVMGGALGQLAVWTGGLMAPVVAHAVYDAAAMSYIRWGRDCTAISSQPGLLVRDEGRSV